MKNLIKRDLSLAPPPANDGAMDAFTLPEAPPQIPSPGASPSADDTDAIVAAAKAERDAKAAARGPRMCLVVDDSRMIRKVARRILEPNGFAVTEAENGEEAIAACRAARFDLVMTDWDMPVMSGLEFVSTLRALPGGTAAKVMFCTSKSGVHDIHTGIAAGADEYIVKPFDEPGLRRKLELLGLD